MRMRNTQGPWLILLPLLLLLATTRSVAAGDPVILRLQAPERVTLGDRVPVTVELRDSKGVPIPRATIILWHPASFLSTGGAIQLDQATTDAQGKVTFLFEARSEGPLTLNASFPGDSRYSPAQGSANLTVQGSFQLYREQVGVQVPGVGVWMLAALLAGVWSIYFAVIVLLTLIAHEGSEPAGEAGSTNV